MAAAVGAAVAAAAAMNLFLSELVTQDFFLLSINREAYHLKSMKQEQRPLYRMHFSC